MYFDKIVQFDNEAEYQECKDQFLDIIGKIEKHLLENKYMDYLAHFKDGIIIDDEQMLLGCTADRPWEHLEGKVSKE